MPTVQEIEQALFAWAPKERAMSWDNVGHLLGDPKAEVSRVLVALDITESVAAEAAEKDCQLIVSHHPLMNCNWNPVQTLRPDTPQGHLLLGLLKQNLSAICMHTNLDAAQGGVNDVLAETLGLQEVQPLSEDGIGRVGRLAAPLSLREFAEQVCHTLPGNGLRYVDAGKPVYRVAVGGGACGEYEAAALAHGCDTFVTSDLKYHQFLDAPGKGINLLDAGHFPTEDPVCEKLIRYLTVQFPMLTVQKSASHREVIQYCVKGD